MTFGPESVTQSWFNPGHTSSFPVPDFALRCSVRNMAQHGQGRIRIVNIPDLLAITSYLIVQPMTLS